MGSDRGRQPRSEPSRSSADTSNPSARGGGSGNSGGQRLIRGTLAARAARLRGDGSCRFVGRERGVAWTARASPSWTSKTPRFAFRMPLERRASLRGRDRVSGRPVGGHWESIGGPSSSSRLRAVARLFMGRSGGTQAGPTTFRPSVGRIGGDGPMSNQMPQKATGEGRLIEGHGSSGPRFGRVATVVELPALSHDFLHRLVRDAAALLPCKFTCGDAAPGSCRDHPTARDALLPASGSLQLEAKVAGGSRRRVVDRLDDSGTRAPIELP